MRLSPASEVTGLDLVRAGIGDKLLIRFVRKISIARDPQWGGQAVAEQLRRNTEIRVFLLEAYTVIYSFTASAFHTDRPSVFEDPLALVKIAIPASIVLTVLLVRNAWADSEGRSQLASTVDVSLAFGLVVLAQMALWAYLPALVLPRWRPTQGSWAAWLFLTELRTLFPPGSGIPGNFRRDLKQPMYLDEIRWRAEEIGREIRRRNMWVYGTAAAVSGLCVVCFALATTAHVRIGAAVIIVGTLCVVRQVRCGRADAPGGADFELYREFCRSELERQRGAVKRIRYWYVGALIPGLLLVLWGSFVYAYVVLMYVLLGAELIYRVTVRLQQEHDEVAFSCAVTA